jgi:hypothetical protein
MTTRLSTTLASLAGSLLVASGGLLATGSVLAAAGIAAGWPIYLVGYASMVITLPALAATHGRRLRRFGRTAFAIATTNAVLGTPVVAMVTTYVLGATEAHVILMAYVLTPVGMVAAFGMNLSMALVGVAIVRARAFQARVGWLVVVGAVIEFPVELGLLPLPVWAFAMILAAIAFGLVARQLSAAPTREALATA